MNLTLGDICKECRYTQPQAMGIKDPRCSKGKQSCGKESTTATKKAA